MFSGLLQRRQKETVRMGGWVPASSWEPAAGTGNTGLKHTSSRALEFWHSRIPLTSAFGDFGGSHGTWRTWSGPPWRRAVRRVLPGMVLSCDRLCLGSVGPLCDDRNGFHTPGIPQGTHHRLSIRSVLKRWWHRQARWRHARIKVSRPLCGPRPGQGLNLFSHKRISANECHRVSSRLTTGCKLWAQSS